MRYIRHRSRRATRRRRAREARSAFAARTSMCLKCGRARNHKAVARCIPADPSLHLDVINQVVERLEEGVCHFSFADAKAVRCPRTGVKWRGELQRPGGGADAAEALRPRTSINYTHDERKRSSTTVSPPDRDMLHVRGGRERETYMYLSRLSRHTISMTAHGKIWVPLKALRVGGKL